MKIILMILGVIPLAIGNVVLWFSWLEIYKNHYETKFYKIFSFCVSVFLSIASIGVTIWVFYKLLGEAL